MKTIQSNLIVILVNNILLFLACYFWRKQYIQICKCRWKASRQLTCINLMGFLAKSFVKNIYASCVLFLFLHMYDTSFSVLLMTFRNEDCIAHQTYSHNSLPFLFFSSSIQQQNPNVFPSFKPTLESGRKISIPSVQITGVI